MIVPESIEQHETNVELPGLCVQNLARRAESAGRPRQEPGPNSDRRGNVFEPLDLESILRVSDRNKGDHERQTEDQQDDGEV